MGADEREVGQPGDAVGRRPEDDAGGQPADGAGAPTGRGRRRRLRRAVRAVAAAGAAVVLALVAVNVAVARASAPHTYAVVEEVPARPVAIVFGAGIEGDRPSPMLAQRVDAAVELWRAGTVEHLLVTGDNSHAGYDEPTVMRDRALAAGVPPDRVTRDFAGFDTYDSCLRARDVFGVEAAVLVTQAYHQPRALATCRALGIDAVGLALPDWGHDPDAVPFDYARGLVVSLQAREYLATVKAMADVHVLEPDPTFGGPRVALGSDLAPPGVPGEPVPG